MRRLLLPLLRGGRSGRRQRRPARGQLDPEVVQQEALQRLHPPLQRPVLVRLDLRIKTLSKKAEAPIVGSQQGNL